MTIVSNILVFVFALWLVMVGVSCWGQAHFHALVFDRAVSRLTGIALIVIAVLVVVDHFGGYHALF